MESFTLGSVPSSSQWESVTSASLQAKPHVHPVLHFPFPYDHDPEITEPPLLASPIRNSSTPPFSSLSCKTSAVEALTVIPVHTWLENLCTQTRIWCFKTTHLKLDEGRDCCRGGSQTKTQIWKPLMTRWRLNRRIFQRHAKIAALGVEGSTSFMPAESTEHQENIEPLTCKA